MNWRTVTGAVVFAVLVTAAGYLLPFLGSILLWPGHSVGWLLDNFGGTAPFSWFGVWLQAYSQLLFWVLVRELARTLSNRLQEWGAKRAVRV